MNLFRRLKQLIAGPIELTGTITALNADGTSTVQLTGGGLIRCPGQPYTISTRVFVRNHEIIGDAPSLPSFSIDVD